MDLHVFVRAIDGLTEVCVCVGFNVETVEYKNISFTVWDVGGQDKVRVKTRERRAAARDGRAVEDVRGGGRVFGLARRFSSVGCRYLRFVRAVD